MAGLLRGVVLTVGVLIALCSAALVVSAIADIASPGTSTTSPGTNAALVVFFLGTTAVGAYMIWQAVKTSRAPDATSASSQSSGGRARPGHPTAGSPHAESPDSDADRERRILQFAEAEHGRVTIAEVAAHCRVTVTEARTDLDRMVTQQVAQLLVTETGVLVYVFPGFLSDDEKASAHDF